MSDAAIRSTLPPSEPGPETDIQVQPSPTSRRAPDGPLRKALKAIASLRLTVVLFVLSLLLVFFGTLAQVDQGIWTVVKDYFRSFVAWIPFQTFVRFAQTFLNVSKTAKVDGSFPFPGGLLIGSLLMVNLVAAHLIRFKMTWKRSGVLILHAGLIVLLLGELVTGQMAVEAKMVILNGEAVNFVDVTQQTELAFTDSSDPTDDSVVVVPGEMLAKAVASGDHIIRDPQLPVDVEVLEYMKNSDLAPLREGQNAKDVRVSQTGVPFRFINRAEEVGVDTNQREDAPAARVALRDKKTGEVLGKFLVCLWYYPNFTSRVPMYQFAPQQVVVNDKPYTVELRFKRNYKPYTIELKKFTHEVYPGTEVAKDYSSDVRLQDTERGENRDVKIYMNNPLRYRGETFYQSGVIAGDRGTILQVVDNPGAWMPYVSCTLVSIGMIVHFMIHLSGFVSRRTVA